MAIDTEERTNDSSKKSTTKSGNKKPIVIILIVVGALAVLGVIGSLITGHLAKKGAESFLSGVTGEKVKLDTNKDGGRVTVGDNNNKTEFDTSESGSVSLNSKFPKDDVKIYPGARIKSSSGSSSENGGIFTNALLETKDDKNKVLSFYEDFFKKENGWEQTYSSETNNGFVQSWTNKSKDLSVALTIGTDEKKLTSIVLTVTIVKEN